MRRLTQLVPLLGAVALGGMASYTAMSIAVWIRLLFVFLCVGVSFYTCVQWLGRVRGSAACIALACFFSLVQISAVYSGFPFGALSYGEGLGPKAFGLTPWATPFLWIPFVIGVMPLASRMGRRFAWQVAWGGVLVMVIDLVVDPGAARMGLWQFAGGGGYYGIPVTNFLGWVMTGLLGSGIVQAFAAFATTPPSFRLWMGAEWSLALWTGYALGTALWIPAAIGLVMLGSMAWFRLQTAQTSSMM